MVEAVNAFGSGVAGLSVLFPHAHSTHVCPFFSLTHSSLVSSLSPRFCFEILLTHRFWGVFGSHAGFLPLPHELLSTHELQIHVLPAVCASTDKNGAVFPHAGPPLAVPFLAGSDCLTTHRYSSVWGAHGELRAVLLHPRLTVKGHSRFWLSHRLFGSFFPML